MAKKSPVLEIALKQCGLEKDWFFEHRNPREMFACADAMRSALGGERYFNEPGISWLREAWVMGAFGIAADAKTVRLGRKDPPDGYALILTSESPVEISEAGDPDRRRGDEYQRPITGVESIPSEMLDAAEQSYVEWIGLAIRRKLAKQHRLPIDTILLIKFSAWLFKDAEELAVSLRSFTEFSNQNIRAVCVVNDSFVFGPHWLISRGVYKIR